MEDRLTTLPTFCPQDSVSPKDVGMLQLEEDKEILMLPLQEDNEVLIPARR